MHTTGLDYANGRIPVLFRKIFFLLPSLFPALGMWAAIPASEFCTFLIIITCRFMPR